MVSSWDLCLTEDNGSSLKSSQMCSHYLALCIHLCDAFEPIKVSISVAFKTQYACHLNSYFFNDTCCVRVNLSPVGPNCKASTNSWLILGGMRCKSDWGTSENSNRLWLQDSSLYCWKKTETSDPLKSLANRNYGTSQQYQDFMSLSLNQESPDLNEGCDCCHFTPQL